MKTIKCVCGKDILLDDENYETVSRRNYSCNGGSIYFIAKSKGGKRVGITLTWLLGITIEPGMELDHIDHNIHNCQKSNLRPVTHQQNSWNQSKHKNNTSGFVGVARYNYGNYGWRGYVKKDGKTYHAGVFDSLSDAAKARDILAIKLFGEFANLNFPIANYFPSIKEMESL